MLIALYVASTLYHSMRGRAKAILQKFDHCSIYLLIAGSYTPFALVSLRGVWGWSLLGAFLQNSVKNYDNISTDLES